jgi:hypothetical protein
MADSLLAFDFLPQDACPVLLFVTEGVFSLSNMKTETICKINDADVTFVLVNISGTHHSDYLYCFVPNIGMSLYR